jgi:ribosomal protein S27AE
MKVCSCDPSISPPRLDLGGLWGGLLLPIFGLRPGLVRFCGDERFVGERKLGVGVPIEPFQLAQRRCERCGLVYTDDPDVTRSRCSQCGRVNEAIKAILHACGDGDGGYRVVRNGE